MNEISFRKRSKLHRCCYFEPLFYPAVMMFEEVHMPLILWGQKRIYITFTSNLTEMCETTCLAREVKRIFPFREFATNQTTMRCDGIVETGLVSGSCYNVGVSVWCRLFRNLHLTQRAAIVPNDNGSARYSRFSFRGQYSMPNVQVGIITAVA